MFSLSFSEMVKFDNLDAQGGLHERPGSGSDPIDEIGSTFSDNGSSPEVEGVTLSDVGVESPLEAIPISFRSPSKEVDSEMPPSQGGESPEPSWLGGAVRSARVPKAESPDFSGSEGESEDTGEIRGRHL